MSRLTALLETLLVLCVLFHPLFSFFSPLPSLMPCRMHRHGGVLMNNKPPSNPDRMRLNYMKARSVTSKSSRIEAKTQASKIPEKQKIRRITRLQPTPDKPVFELFVKANGSPWSVPLLLLVCLLLLTSSTFIL